MLIGIAYAGKAIAGVINQPFYNYQVRTTVNDPVSEHLVTLVKSNVLPVSSAQEQN